MRIEERERERTRGEARDQGGRRREHSEKGGEKRGRGSGESGEVGGERNEEAGMPGTHLATCPPARPA